MRMVLKINNLNMKAITKILMVCGLLVGGMMISNTASAQSADAASPAVRTEKAVSGTSAHKTCGSAAKKSCCAKKTAMGGSATSTSANGGTAANTGCSGHAAKKCSSAEKKACTGHKAEHKE